VFAAREMGRYEAEGRVLASCVERCLVCLDDYAPEDACRLMACKHAFHRECVDRWMATGRNNCPACRGAVGVLICEFVGTADEMGRACPLTARRQCRRKTDSDTFLRSDLTLPPLTPTS
jgi:hypothetical protein